MLEKIKLFFLKLKRRKVYKQLPTAVKMQLYLEMMHPENSDLSYNDILKREFEFKGDCNATK